MTTTNSAPATLAVGTKLDAGKARMDLAPPEALMALGEVLGFGARKYAARNWEKGMDWGRLYGAAQRHLIAWSAGEDEDPESGMPHLWHALTNIAFLIAYEVRGAGNDDRTTYTLALDEKDLTVMGPDAHHGTMPAEPDDDEDDPEDWGCLTLTSHPEFLNGVRATARPAAICTAKPIC